MQSLIPALAPVITWLVKSLVEKFSSRVPGLLWPLVCAGVGVVADQIAAALAHGTPNAWVGLALGAAGVGVRELANQLPKAPQQAKGDAGTGIPGIKLMLLLALPVGMLIGCSTIVQDAKSTDPKTGETREVKSTVRTVLQSQQAVDKVRVSAGSVVTAGAAGVQQSSDAATLAGVVGNIMLKGMAAYMSGGAALAVPGTTSSGTAALPGASIGLPMLTGDTNTWPSAVVRLPNGDLKICWPNGACFLMPAASITTTNR